MNILTKFLNPAIATSIFLALAFPLNAPAASNNNDAAARQAREQQARQQQAARESAASLEARNACYKTCSDAQYATLRGCDKLADGQKMSQCRFAAADEKMACTTRCDSRYPVR